MLKLCYKNLQRDPFWIMERNYAIGRAEDNHLNLEHPSVAPHHARISRDRDSYTIRDLGSTTGTYVNGKRVSVQPICCGDVLQIGDITLEIIDPIAAAQAAGGEYWSLVGNSSWLAGQEFPLQFSDAKPLLVGRGKHCDLVFPGTHLSREHARIDRVAATQVRIEAVKPGNAIFVNDDRMPQATLKPGDQLRLDVYRFTVFGPGIQLHKCATRPPAKNKTARKPLQRQVKSSPKTAKATERRWKTAPTSPGNREEPTHKSTSSNHWLLALLLLVLLVSVLARVLLSDI